MLLMTIVVPGEDALGVAAAGAAGAVVGSVVLAGAVTVTRAAGAAARVVPHAAKPPIRARVPIPAKMVLVVFMMFPRCCYLHTFIVR